jgi:flagellar protein FlaG
VQFQLNPAYKEVIIKVVDQENDKVIRQIPSEDGVRIAKAMDNLKGLLFAQSV